MLIERSYAMWWCGRTAHEIELASSFPNREPIYQLIDKAYSCRNRAYCVVIGVSV